MNKKFCATHHLYYQGNECPMCLSERLSYYSHKFNVSNSNNNAAAETHKKVSNKKNREINEDDISKLMDKFNHR